MGLFNRGSRATQQALRLPTGIDDFLETFGQFEFDPRGSGVDPDAGYWMPTLYELSQQDGNAFIEAISDASFRRGGWALYGGDRTVMNMVGTYPEVNDPFYPRLLDASIAFVVAQDVDPNLRLAPYHHRRMADASKSSGT
jgi:hypothetical protein